MAITNGYATLPQVLATKKITTANPADDSVIESLIEAVSRHIDSLTGRRFYTTTADETRYYAADEFGDVYPDDLLSITTLKTDEDGDRVYEVTWATTDYDLLPVNAGLDNRPYIKIETSPEGRYTFTQARKSIQIVGKFGHPLPDDISQACVQIVVNLYNSRYGVGAEGAATITGAGVVITPKDVGPLALAIINSHARQWI